MVPLKHLKKLYPIFLNIELNRNELEINKLIKYKYKDDPQIVNIIKAI